MVGYAFKKTELCSKEWLFTQVKNGNQKVVDFLDSLTEKTAKEYGQAVIDARHWWNAIGRFIYHTAEDCETMKRVDERYA